MNNRAKNNTNMISNDIVIYFMLKILEGLIGIISLRILTNIFSPALYGDYSIIYSTVLIIALVSSGWLSQAGYRFVHQYTDKVDKKIFYSTIFITWLMINIIIITIAYMTIVLNLINLQQIYIIIIAMFLFHTITEILLAQLSSLRKIKLNGIMILLRAILKIIFIIIFTNLVANNIYIIFLSYVITDVIISCIAFLKMKLYRYIGINNFSKKLVLDFIQFGMPITGNMLALYILNVSDRYIIRYLYGNEMVGVYNANYSVVSASFQLLMVGMMKGAYPNILKAWQKQGKEMAENLLTQSMQYYLTIAIPAVVGISLMAKQISMLIISEDSYNIGYIVIPWVALGIMLYGLSDYSNKAWELTNKTRTIFFHTLICAIMNVILNIILMPTYGYQIASITTMISFLFYFILSYSRSKKILNCNLSFIKIFKIIIASFVMGTVIIILNNIISKTNSIITMGITVCIGMFTYGATLLMLGELKDEVKLLKNKVIKK